MQFHFSPLGGVVSPWWKWWSKAVRRTGNRSCCTLEVFGRCWQTNSWTYWTTLCLKRTLRLDEKHNDLWKSPSLPASDSCCFPSALLSSKLPQTPRCFQDRKTAAWLTVGRRVSVADHFTVTYQPSETAQASCDGESLCLEEPEIWMKRNMCFFFFIFSGRVRCAFARKEGLFGERLIMYATFCTM